MGLFSFSKKQTEKTPSPQTAAETIPYLNVYKYGIIETVEGEFSKSYKLPSVNFKSADDKRQWDIAEEWGKFLSSFDDKTTIEVTLINKTIDMNRFQEEVFIPMKPDGLNEYREEYNQMLAQKMTSAKNNLETLKILTVSVKAETVAKAIDKFNNIEHIITEHIPTITTKDVEPIDTIERLELLNYIYNQDSNIPLYQKRKRTVDGEVEEVESFTFETLAREGISTKNLIAPGGFAFTGKHIQVGENYAKTYFVANYPNWASGKILTDFADISTNAMISVLFKPYSRDDAIKIIKRQNNNIAAQLAKTQKDAAKSGIDAALISPDKAKDKEEVDIILDEITKGDGVLFDVSMNMTIFANNPEDLSRFHDEIKSIANGLQLTIRPYSLQAQQEASFNTCLPLAHDWISSLNKDNSRYMTTASVSTFVPFDVQDVNVEDGMYYGLHGTTRTMILYNRTADINSNGCILGMPGAGKSFTAKREMINILLNTDDDILIIDPEREYEPLVKAFGGAQIKIAPGTNNYINPFDLNLENKDSDTGKNPVNIKNELITSLLEIMIGGKFGLSPIQTSIIDRVNQEIFVPFMHKLTAEGKTVDRENNPTLKDFLELLQEQPEPEAAEMALSLDKYVYGFSDIFAKKTTVSSDNRFVVYDIRDIGDMKEVGSHICLDNIWSRMIENKAKGKRTWFYIDEFHLLMKNPSSAKYIAEIWKRARKFYGVPMAITQNVQDMLANDDALTVINNCSFVCLLGQAPINRNQLTDMYNISPTEKKYISTAKAGMGLLKIQDYLIPMVDEFPKNTKLYKIMSTKPGEEV